MATRSYDPSESGPDGRSLVVVLIDGYSGTAARVEVRGRYRQQSFRELVLEFLPTARDGMSDRGVLYNLSRRRPIPLDHRPDESVVGHEEILLFGPPGWVEEFARALPTDNPDPNPGVPFEEALSVVSRFRQTYLPRWVMCRVTDEEYERLLHEAVRTLGRDEQFPCERVYAELNRSLDQNLQSREVGRHHAGAGDFLAAVLLRAGVHCRGERSRFLAGCGLRQSAARDRPGGARRRFIGNPAAVHMSPAPDFDDHLVSLVRAGRLQVGRVMVYTGSAPDTTAELTPEVEG